MSMHSPEMEKARAEWEEASSDCARILREMALLDVEEPVYGELLEEFCVATEKRRAAGDSIHKISSAAMRAIGKTLKSIAG